MLTISTFSEVFFGTNFWLLHKYWWILSQAGLFFGKSNFFNTNDVMQYRYAMHYNFHLYYEGNITLFCNNESITYLNINTCTFTHSMFFFVIITNSLYFYILRWSCQYHKHISLYVGFHILAYVGNSINKKSLQYKAVKKTTW